MTARLETLGSLLAAMAVVAMTGELPSDVCRQESTHPCKFDIDRRIKIIVPLYRRYPFLFAPGRRNHYGHPFQQRHRQLLKDQFGLRWCGARIRQMATLQVMPSTIQIELARHMAGGDRERTETLLLSRATSGLRASVDAVSLRLHARVITPDLWRFAGNADCLWFALRDDMEQLALRNCGAE